MSSTNPTGAGGATNVCVIALDDESRTAIVEALRLQIARHSDLDDIFQDRAFVCEELPRVASLLDRIGWWTMDAPEPTKMAVDPADAAYLTQALEDLRSDLRLDLRRGQRALERVRAGDTDYYFTDKDQCASERTTREELDADLGLFVAAERMLTHLHDSGRA